MISASAKVTAIAVATLLAVAVGAPSPAAAATTFSAGHATGLSPAKNVDARALPVPDADSFYSVPTDIAEVKPGAVIRSRPVSVGPTSGVVGAASAYQVLYRTVDNQDQPTATVATVLTPVVPWLGGGARPLLSYQAAEDGLDTTCAPSYLMASGSPNFLLEATNVTLALAEGWTVTLPDYEGPRSQFLGATAEPRAVLDAVRATLSFAPAGVSDRSSVGLWGSSGGAFATAHAAQLQRVYAPELNVQAVVTGALPAELNAALATLSGNPTAPLVPFLIAAIARSYPDAHIEKYLSEKGRQQVSAVAGKCLSDAQGSESQVASLPSIEAWPGSLTSGAFHDLVFSLSPAGVPGVPAAPVYDYHGLIDQVAPLAPDRALMTGYCTAGVRVTHIELPAEHTTSIVLGSPGALLFLGARFAGIVPPTTSTKECA